MAYETVYFTDEPRNAVKVLSEGHPGNQRQPTRGTIVRSPAGTMVGYGGTPYAPSPYGVPPYGYPSSHQVVMTPQGPMAVPVAGNAGLFGSSGPETGEWIDIGLQVLAAILPLPAAPSTAGTSIEDNTANMIAFQGSIASYAKRDELIRTAAGVLKTLFRRG
ncbi:MAG TPA: hypothetical protein VGM88_13115 [Kofleriaceae bacterium]|jgi:hypothetical protein